MEEKPHDQRIRERAFQLWEAQGRPLGRDDFFWAQAEREITEEETKQETTATNADTEEE